jgi:hypothetical protein
MADTWKTDPVWVKQRNRKLVQADHRHEFHECDLSDRPAEHFLVNGELKGGRRFWRIAALYGYGVGPHYPCSWEFKRHIKRRGGVFERYPHIRRFSSHADRERRAIERASLRALLNGADAFLEADSDWFAELHTPDCRPARHLSDWSWFD